MAWITQPPEKVTIHADGTMTEHFGEPKEGYYTKEEIVEHYKNSEWVAELQETQQLAELIKKHPKKAAAIILKTI